MVNTVGTGNMGEMGETAEIRLHGELVNLGNFAVLDPNPVVLAVGRIAFHVIEEDFEVALGNSGIYLDEGGIYGFEVDGHNLMGPLVLTQVSLLGGRVSVAEVIEADTFIGTHVRLDGFHKVDKGLAEFATGEQLMSNEFTLAFIEVAHPLHTDCSMCGELNLGRFAERQNAKGFIFALVILDFHEKLVAGSLDILHIDVSLLVVLPRCSIGCPSSGHLGNMVGTGVTRR
jgi:hypothetical protein